MTSEKVQIRIALHLSMFVLFLALSLPFVQAVSNATDKVISGTASLKVTLISQDPDPVGPGNFVDVRFKVDNVGSQNAKGVEIQLLPRFPFSLDPGDSGIRNIGSIQGGQAGEEGVIVKYRLRVADDALQATSEIEIRYRHADIDWQKFDPFLVDVKTPDAFLAIDAVDVEPSPLRPGEEGTLTLRVRNVADSLLRNIKIDLDLTGSSFAPVGSTASAYIGRLESGKSSEVIMKLFADPQASSKAHRLPLRMTYADDSLTIYSKNYTVGILVYDGPSYVLNVEDRTLQAQNKKGKVTVSISNTGSGDMKYVTLEILPSDKYVVLSKDAEYLGNLESDDFETAEFEIYPATNDLLVPIDVSVRYKDSFNKEYADKRQVKLQLYSSAELKKYELTPKQSRVWLVVALFVVLLAAWIAYRRWERKRLRKRQKEAEA